VGDEELPDKINQTAVAPGILEAFLGVLAKTPELLGLLIAGRLSGQFWLYILMANGDFPEKRIKYINNHIGIAVLGIISFVPEFVVLYYIRNGFGIFEYTSSLELILTTVIASYTVQALILVILFLRRRTSG
jgi:uncharacterized membrane protein